MAALKVKVRHFGDGKMDRVLVPIASATAISKGEVVSYESGAAVAVDAATDDATFLGVSEDDHAANSGDGFITVITKCVVEAPVASAAYTIGAGLKYNTAGTLEADGAANTIAWSIEDTAAANVTSLKVLIDVVKLGKLFPVSA